jgi:hypothetical protein
MRHRPPGRIPSPKPHMCSLSIPNSNQPDHWRIRAAILRQRHCKEVYEPLEDPNKPTAAAIEFTDRPCRPPWMQFWGRPNCSRPSYSNSTCRLFSPRFYASAVPGAYSSTLHQLSSNPSSFDPSLSHHLIGRLSPESPTLFWRSSFRPGSTRRYPPIC